MSKAINKWQVDRFTARMGELEAPLVKKLNACVQAAVDEIPKPTYHTIHNALGRVEELGGIIPNSKKYIVEEEVNICISPGGWKDGRYINVQHECLPGGSVDLMGIFGYTKRNVAMYKKYKDAIKGVKAKHPAAKMLVKLAKLRQQLVDEVTFQGAWYASDAITRFVENIEAVIDDEY